VKKWKKKFVGGGGGKGLERKTSTASVSLEEKKGPRLDGNADDINRDKVTQEISISDKKWGFVQKMGKRNNLFGLRGGKEARSEGNRGENGEGEYTRAKKSFVSEMTNTSIKQARRRGGWLQKKNTAEKEKSWTIHKGISVEKRRRKPLGRGEIKGFKQRRSF